MQSSRILRSAAEKHGFLLPPRTSIDIFASAADAFLNLLSSEDHRKKFVSSMNSGIIPEVLGQANLSYLRILALHDELDSPILKEHGFDVNEFLEGVKPALEELHEVQSNLQNKLNVIASSSEEDDDDDDAMDVSDGNMLPSMLFPNPETDKIVRRLLKKKHAWKHVAEEDPESEEARLVAMLSPQHFERFEMASKLSFGFAPQFYDLNVQVHNVALLSARGMIIESDDETFENDEISNDEALQKASDNEEDSGSRLPAVAAQVEVLYDVEETLEVPVEEGEEANENKNDEKETKTVTRTSVVVGVFEGWLSGGDDPEGLRWRVADIRFPFEFPFIAARGLNE